MALELGAAAQERWKNFIEGYRESSPLALNDFGAIALFAPARHFWFLGEYASRSDEWGSAVVPPGWLRTLVDRLEQEERLSRLRSDGNARSDAAQEKERRVEHRCMR